MHTMHTPRHQHIGRRIVTGVVAATILIAAAWSVANIATVANHYHESRAAWLLGLAFGSANAISVYIFAISPAGSQARRPAIVGTLIFGVGSAAIQFHLYNEIETVAANVAVWFAALGPLAEALLAWLEASLNADEEQRRTEEAQTIDEALSDRLRRQIERLEEDNERRKRDNKALAAQLEKERALLEQQLQRAPAPAPAPAPASAPASAVEEFTDEQLQQIEQIRRIVEQHQISKAADLVEVANDVDSVRSAQRMLKMAKDAGAITKNGAGYKPVHS